jgi:transcriptional regulator with XRE-family HTH domain
MEEQTGRPHTGPRYVPRDLLVDPSEFGRNPTPDFVQWTRENASHRAGAQAQHVLSLRIHEALRQRDMTVAQLASATNLNYQRLTRVLRGTIVMRMEDLGVIARVIPEAFDYVLGTAANPVFTGAAARRLATLNATRDQMRAELEELGNQIQDAEAREKEAPPWDHEGAPVSARGHHGGNQPGP